MPKSKSKSLNTFYMDNCCNLFCSNSLFRLLLTNFVNLFFTFIIFSLTLKAQNLNISNFVSHKWNSTDFSDQTLIKSKSWNYNEYDNINTPSLTPEVERNYRIKDTKQLEETVNVLKNKHDKLSNKILNSLNQSDDSVDNGTESHGTDNMDWVPESHSIQTINKTSQIDYCDLAFINNKEKEALSQFFSVNQTETSDLSHQDEIRTKRALAKIFTIETAIFVDKSLAKRFEGKMDDLKRLVLSIMNEVQLIYEYSSMKTRVQIVIVKLEILTSNGPDDAQGDIDKYLDNFCAWQARLYRAENWASRWDHALMLTGLDLYKDQGNGKKNKKVLGLAWVNGMCKPTYSCTLNEGKSFEASFVIAHELGHSLGILHDGRGNNCDPDKYIMSEKTGPGKINWSPCSNVYITNFISRGNGRCLENVAMASSEMDFRRTYRLPGEQFPPNMQCQLALGSQYKAYVSSKEPFSDICRELWCLSGSWATPAHPALEGSQCGSNGERCYQGSCSISRDIIDYNQPASLSQLTSGGKIVPITGLTRPGNGFTVRRWTRNRSGFRPITQRKGSTIGMVTVSTPFNRRRFNRKRGAVLEKPEAGPRSALKDQSGRSTQSSTKEKVTTSKSIIEFDDKSDNSWMESIRKGIKSITDGARKLFSNIFSG